MPKIIIDAKKKILDAACRQFHEKTFKEVDIKEIAKEAAVAPGTIYNYFENKQNIFIKAYEKTWRTAFDEIIINVREQTSKERALRVFLRGFYWKAVEFHNITEEFLKVTAPEKQPRFRRLNYLTTLVAKLIQEIFKDDKRLTSSPNRSRRVAVTIVMTLWGLTIYYPDEHENNLIYLSQFVRYIFSMG